MAFSINTNIASLQSQAYLRISGNFQQKTHQPRQPRSSHHQLRRRHHRANVEMLLAALRRGSGGEAL
jgi:hypothetical protein